MRDDKKDLELMEQDVRECLDLPGRPPKEIFRAFREGMFLAMKRYDGGFKEALPTEPGYYWCQQSADDCGVVLILLDETTNTLQAFEHGIEGFESLDQYARARWAGPMIAPLSKEIYDENRCRKP